MKKQSITFLNLWVVALAVIGFNGSPENYFNRLLNQEKPTAIVAEDPIELVPAVSVENSPHAASVIDEQLAQKLDALGLNVGTGTISLPGSLNHCKSIVYKTLRSLPAEAVTPLKNVTLKFNSDGLRGQAGGSQLVLKCVEMEDEELVGVLVHEMGHVVDTGLLLGSADSGNSEFMDGTNPVFKNDLSLDFYRLSFVSERELRTDATKLDFVSGYAMSDPFEDFAESYNYYILHGAEFRKLLPTSKTLAKKYEYLFTSVFHGKEYNNGEESNVLLRTRSFDTTVLSYDLKKFFVL